MNVALLLPAHQKKHPHAGAAAAADSEPLCQTQ